METVLVTGGAGYIGSHACKALAGAGFRVVTVDNLNAGHRWAVRWGPLVEGDAEDRGLVAVVLKEYGVSAVLHFASQASVGESMHLSARYSVGNAAGAMALLEAMAECGVRRIVFSSSCAVYGVPPGTPITETSPLAPVNPYGESKLDIERALRWYGGIHGFSWAALLYFNPAGADSEAEIGECHDPETHVIPLAVQTALGLRPDFQIMGTDYPTPDGTAPCDYVHVSGLAGAHIVTFARLKGGGESRAYNPETGRPYSVREVVAAAEKATGKRVPALESGRRSEDPPCLYADSARARSELGRQPRYDTLDSIVASAACWNASAGPASRRAPDEAGVRFTSAGRP
jgi:UDP-arabinose 4-epimerase